MAKMGRPKKHTKGVGKLNLYLPKAVEVKYRKMAKDENLQLNEFLIKLMEHYEKKNPVDELTDDLTRIANGLGATLIKED